MRRHARRLTSSRPWKLCTTDNPDHTLEDGTIRGYPQLIDAANALVHAPEQYKTILFDDGQQVRELSDVEQAFVERVASMLGYEVEQLGGNAD
jgi:hypothetical protein